MLTNSVSTTNTRNISVPRTAPVSGSTIAQAYLQRLELSAEQPVYLIKRDGKYQPFLWRELHDRVLAVVDYYERLGVGPGDRVVILSQSRPEWNITDLTNLCLGVITVPIYHSSSLEDTAFILDHCGAKLAFVEDAVQLKKITDALARNSKKIPLVLYGDTRAEGLQRFDDLVKQGKRASERLRETAAKLNPKSEATIVYTSGTTGTPKGAVLTHENLVAEIQGVTQAVHFYPEDKSLSFLPFAHILGRIESLIPVFTGMQLGFAESINSVPQNIQELKPSVLVSVPRIYEKIFSKIQSEISSAPALKKTIFGWSVRTGRRFARLKTEQTPIPLALAVKYAVADKLVFEKIRTKLGGKLRFAISGGAPLSQELAEFFFACGVHILEGYGLTETTAAVTCNRPEDLCFGSVGKPLPGISIRVATDGEIQMKGSVIFKEYYKNASATQEAMTPDGWFCSGDIGEFNARGFLKITDRKKELIVTSGGKNIAPQKLENLLKTNLFVSNAMVYGDKEKYLVVLVTPNEPELLKWAKAKNVAVTTIADLVEKPEILALYDDALRVANESLASYESIKKCKILSTDFTVETGELTPSLKIKRKIITAKFKSQIESMYTR